MADQDRVSEEGGASAPGGRHPLHRLARCPYHPEGEELRVRPIGPAGSESSELSCASCRRRYTIEQGIYRLMPDEMRDEREGAAPDADPETAQRLREMHQRDGRAESGAPGYAPSRPGSPLEWMNVQYDAVTRNVRVPAGGVCIDFGTGVGRYIPWLLERAAHVVGTDFSLVSLKRLRGALPRQLRSRCLLVQTDLSRLGLAPQIGAAGLCVEVLQHLPSPELRALAVLEMGRVLSPGADLFLVTKSFTAISRLLGMLKLAQWKVARLAGAGGDQRPLVDRETVDGAIYTYRHTYGELRRLVAHHFLESDARGIISFGMFPLTLLPREARYRVDAWMEGRRIGRFFGQDIFLHARRNARVPGS